MKILRALSLCSLLLIPASVEAVVRDICSTCTHTTIASFEAAANDGDIGEIQDSATYNERWIVGGERTMRVSSGSNPTVGNQSGAATSRGAVDLDPAGAGPVTIDGSAGSLTLRNNNTTNAIIDYDATSGSALAAVIRSVTFEYNAANVVGIEWITTLSGATLSVEECMMDGSGSMNTIGLDVNTATGTGVDVQNTFFQDCATGADVSGSLTGIVGTWINNTFAGNTDGLISNERIVLTDNLFGDNTDDVDVSDAFDKNDGTFNIFEEEPSTGWPASNIHSVTVTFINAGAGDYHLALGSRGEDEGTTTSTSIDFDGDTRPRAAAYDIGADENEAFFSVTPTPTPTQTPIPTLTPTPTPTPIPQTVIGSRSLTGAGR